MPQGPRPLPRPAAWRETVARFDHRVDRAFDRVRGRPAFDRLFYGASELADFSLVWLILGALRGLRSEHDWHAAVRVGTLLAAESLLVNVGVKSLFRRHRPVFQGERPLKLRIPLTTAFPSGHASAAFCAAGLLSEDDPLGAVYYAVAGVVAASRVHVKIHHTSDVLGGAALGVVLGRIGRRLVPLPVAPVPADSPIVG